MKKLFFVTLYILIFYNVAVQGQSNITQNRAWEISGSVPVKINRS